MKLNNPNEKAFIKSVMPADDSGSDYELFAQALSPFPESYAEA